jgi:uncharacterized protein YebE (UPF0316 family)
VRNDAAERLLNMDFFRSETFAFVVLPVLIFAARVCDVTIGTMRIIYVSRGAKILAPMLGFIEILIWLVAIGHVMQNLDNVYCYIAYAGGFAAGNFVGIFLEGKLAVGTLMIQTITRKDASELVKNLRSEGYGVTAVGAKGSSGDVHIVYTVVKRANLDHVVVIIKRFNPKAFYSIQDVRFATEAIYPLRKPLHWKDTLSLLKFRKKGK